MGFDISGVGDENARMNRTGNSSRLVLLFLSLVLLLALREVASR